MILFEENDDRFYIKESTLQNAGKGVFASRDISKDEYLPISGVMVKRDSDADQCTYFFNSYKFAANVKRCGDMVDIGENVIVPLGFAAIVNHINDQRQSVEIRYVGDQFPQKSSHSGKAVYWFIRDVKKDEEIFGNYGKGWNDVLNWANDVRSTNQIEKQDWEKFILIDLYGLKELVQ
jgi:hypothetical protein